MGKIYIAGPITGHDDYLTKFEKAESYLTAKGYDDIVNPALICLTLNASKTTHKQYMKISKVLLGMCDTAYMLEGWQYSKGASEEHAKARARGLKVIYESDLQEKTVKDGDASPGADMCEMADTSDSFMDVVYKQ